VQGEFLTTDQHVEADEALVRLAHTRVCAVVDKHEDLGGDGADEH